MRPMTDSKSQIDYQPLTTGNAAFSFRSVSKSYASRDGAPVLALDEVSFETPNGGITCIVGPTGSGKSTILRILSGIEQPDSGTVQIGGRPPRELIGRIGYLTQRHTLFPWMKVGENIGMPLELQGTAPDRRHERVRGICTMLGLAGAENRYPYEISGGMQQRAALGRLLASESPVWLMDEPFNALDERTRHRMQELLIGLVREQGLSILFVTHTIDEAVFLADRVIVLTAGPARVAETFDWSVAHPRDRLSREFGETIEQVRRRVESVLKEDDNRYR